MISSPICHSLPVMQIYSTPTTPTSITRSKIDYDPICISPHPGLQQNPIPSWLPGSSSSPHAVPSILVIEVIEKN
ncbi:hypothetical protein PGTUg99_000044 [Puccinia graminis f. sp. tritici]|uniref:Uncharacterized protein n=1 Tax=Puccinia graminis f. sp. tritici TaxID=56615 RepID=A0A5B0RAE6_PUCGR|nr:hypothetical protein PGTUg99_000044 [Puccinia graminis f. sp. tritici]